MKLMWQVVVALVLCMAAGNVRAQFGSFGAEGSAAPWPEPKRVVLGIDPKVKPDYAPVWITDKPNQRALVATQAALDKSLEHVEFNGLPLPACLVKLQTQTGVRFVLDERSLEDVEIKPDLLITCNMKSVSLRGVLNEMLLPQGLGWYPGQEGIVVSTKEEGGTKSLILIYPVQDLISTPEGQDFDTLIELLIAAVRPNSWHEGTGPPRYIDQNASAGALVIDQPWDVQEEVIAFFAGLRQMKTQQGIVGERWLSSTQKKRTESSQSSPASRSSWQRAPRLRWLRSR